jgi:hypothetical protein
MASDNDYEYENEESIDNNLKCPTCNEPSIDPVTTPCHYSFCYQCLGKWFENYHSTCPTCRTTMSKNSSTSITLLPFISCSIKSLFDVNYVISPIYNEAIFMIISTKYVRKRLSVAQLVISTVHGQSFEKNFKFN